jgi:hypothetical protein
MQDEMDTKKRKKNVDTSTKYKKNDVRCNDKNGKLTGSTPQGLTGNPAYDEITKDRNNCSAQDLSNNEMDTKTRKKDVDTSTNN